MIEHVSKPAPARLPVSRIEIGLLAGASGIAGVLVAPWFATTIIVAVRLALTFTRPRAWWLVVMLVHAALMATCVVSLPEGDAVLVWGALFILGTLPLVALAVLQFALALVEWARRQRRRRAIA